MDYHSFRVGNAVCHACVFGFLSFSTWGWEVDTKELGFLLRSVKGMGWHLDWIERNKSLLEINPAGVGRYLNFARWGSGVEGLKAALEMQVAW
jgi:hypothetical protein